MTRLHQACVGAFALSLSLSVVTEAEARPVPQGTFAVSAERLVTSNFHFYPGGPRWHNQLLGAPGWVPWDTPRVGFDYFIIDGLSLGAHLGIGFYALDGNSAGWVSFLPRVGYAFSLSQTIDFWPRVGLGIIAGDPFYAPNDTGVLTLEGMFLANIKPWFAIEFGPAIDVPFAAGYQDVTMGANAGIVLKF
jgi:hypothetical protein